MFIFPKGLVHGFCQKIKPVTFIVLMQNGSIKRVLKSCKAKRALI